MPPPFATPAAAPAWAALCCASRCALNCPACNRRGPGRDPAPEENRFALRELAREGYSALLLTGAEPLARPDLAALVAEARAAGFGAVWASACGFALAETLDAAERAGLDGLLLIARGLSAPSLARFTGGPEAARAWSAGLARLKASPLSWRAVVELNRPVLPELPALLARLAEAGARGVSFHVPDMARLAPFGLDAPPRLAARAADHAGAAARAAGLEVGPHPAATAWAEATSPAERMAARGLSPARVRALMSPDPEDFLSTGLRVGPDGAVWGEVVVRVSGACNMACSFCWLHREDGHVPLDRLLAAVDEQRRALAARGATQLAVVLSGGEPTLHPALLDLVARLAQTGAFVEIQTNGVLLATPGRAEALRRAGAASAQLTFLAARPELSDALTGLPGGWAKTVAGIDRLFEAGFHVSLCVVVCRDNLAALPETTEYVAQRWGGRATGPELSLLMALPLHRLSTEPMRGMTPALGEARPYLEAAVERATAAGLRLGSFNVPCGFPLCAYGRMARRLPLSPCADPAPRDGYHKPPVCGGCALGAACPGVFWRVLEEYGAEDLRPIP